MYPYDKQRSRIELTDTGMSAIMKMSEGNPGAVSVLGLAMRDGAAIDPDSFLCGMSAMLALDTHRIYGSRIWMLYKDVCGQDLRIMLALLRAVQLGWVGDSQLQRAIDNEGEGIDIPAAVAMVEARLPAFQKGPAPVAPEPPMQSHVDYLNSQDDDTTSSAGDVILDAVVAAEVVEVVSDVFSSSNDTPSPDTDTFGGFDGGDSGGGGVTGDF